MKRIYTKEKHRWWKRINWPVIIMFSLLSVSVVVWAIAGFMQSVITGIAITIMAVVPTALLVIWVYSHKK